MHEQRVPRLCAVSKPIEAFQNVFGRRRLVLPVVHQNHSIVGVEPLAFYELLHHDDIVVAATKLALPCTQYASHVYQQNSMITARLLKLSCDLLSL